MQVFRIDPTTEYSCGVALVAAKDTQEAIKTFCEDDYRNYEYDDYNCTCNIIVGMDYDTKEPTVIFDTLNDA